MKRRFLSLFLALLLLSTLAGCQKSSSSQDDANKDSAQQEQQKEEEKTPEENTDDVTIRVAGLKGPTAMGMVKMMDDSAKGDAQGNYDFTLAGAPEELTGPIVQGEFDIAAVPTNLASTLYNKTQGKVQLAALNTLGVLYIVETGDSIQSVEDLRGRTIYATGKGSTPEYVLNYVLTQNGLTPGEDVQVEYKTEHSELAALLAAGQADLALLPQPFVTSVLTQNENARVALDLTQLWEDAAQGESVLTMGCLLVQKSFAQEHPQALATFLKEYQESVDYVTDENNLDEVSTLIEEQGIITKAVAQKALPQCNIVCITGDEMKTMTQGFLEILMNADPTSVGGALPGDDFYYLES